MTIAQERKAARAKSLWSFSLLAFLLLGGFAASQAQDSLNCGQLGRLTYNEDLSDVWGWSDSAQTVEYALVGTRNGFSVVDVTQPNNPVQLRYFSGASSVWRDIKTYGPYAYVVHDNFTGNSDGLMIVDLRTINQMNPIVFRRYPNVNINGGTSQFSRAHNLYIDEKGYLYVFGANIGNGGALVFDLKADPTNPPLSGVFDDYYLHDGVARGDTLWGAAVLRGFFSVINANAKGSMQAMATRNTPSNFTHNIWFSDDNSRVFTTDERRAGFITEYDVSDLNRIRENDRIRTSLSTDVIPHNVHFHNDFLVTSYYSSGLKITDVSVPGSMVEVGYFDTSPSTGNGFVGAWGAYPYLPSGNILVSDINTGLWVISCSYQRASFMNINVVDSVSRANIINASVRILNTNLSGATDVLGNLKKGVPDSGLYALEISRINYQTDTFMIRLQAGQTSFAQFALAPDGLSNEEAALAAWDLYPNPSKGALHLRRPAQGGRTQFRLSDAQGRLLKAGELDPRESQFFWHWDLAPGLYYFELEAAGGSRQWPVVIERP